MIDLNDFCRQAKEISDKRLKLGQFGNRENTTENLLKHCATEVVEAVSAYNNWTYQGGNEGQKEMFETELADVITCIAVIAALENIDLEKAMQKCMEKNRKRIAG